MTITWESVAEIQDGESVQDGDVVPAPDLDAIERTYDEAMACIADMAGAWAPGTDDPWPETEEIDVRAIKPPEASRRSTSPEPAPASPVHEARAPATHVAASRPVVPQRPWRRWFSMRATRPLAAG